MNKHGDLDEARKANLEIGIECARAVLTRTNEAIAHEDKLEAVHDLKNRVEDWKGHRVEGFGDLLLFGTFTVIKSDAAPTKDMEREVSKPISSARRFLLLGSGLLVLDWMIWQPLGSLLDFEREVTVVIIQCVVARSNIKDEGHGKQEGSCHF